jgi:hypothetical protein
VKTRKLKCATCGEYWEEPVRPGARPWECPACNPDAAKRREVERERAARKSGQTNADAPHVDVPFFLKDVVQSIVQRAADFPQPGREELAAQVRRIARAQGHLELREELQNLSALCANWAAWLPTTAKVPHQDDVAA